MSFLPDEMWARILELGTSSAQLDYLDLCSVSAASRRFRRLSGDPVLWSTLLSLDFPKAPTSSSPPSKSLYRLRLEKEMARKQLACRRRIQRLEKKVRLCKLRLQQLDG